MLQLLHQPTLVSQNLQQNIAHPWDAGNGGTTEPSASPHPLGSTIQVGGGESRRQLAPVGNLAALLQPCRGADSLVLPRCTQLPCARGREEGASLRSQARHAPAGTQCVERSDRSGSAFRIPRRVRRRGVWSSLILPSAAPPPERAEQTSWPLVRRLPPSFAQQPARLYLLKSNFLSSVELTAAGLAVPSAAHAAPPGAALEG